MSRIAGLFLDSLKVLLLLPCELRAYEQETQLKVHPRRACLALENRNSCVWRSRTLVWRLRNSAMADKSIYLSMRNGCRSECFEKVLTVSCVHSYEFKILKQTGYSIFTTSHVSTEYSKKKQNARPRISRLRNDIHKLLINRWV